MDTLAVFGSQLVLSLLVYGFIARWYVVPWLAAKPMHQALSILVIPHTIRHLGLTFLVPGVVGDVPGYFATAVAYGDLISGLLALLSLFALRGRWVVAVPLVWVFNIVGTVDLLNALRHADAVPHLAATWYIPTFWVPVLLVTHAMIFARLVSGDRRTEQI